MPLASQPAANRTALPELLPPDLPSRLPPLDAAVATAAALPLGGIGAGNLWLGSRREFLDWELWGRPGQGTRLPFAFAALWWRPDGGGASARVREARRRPPYAAGHGLAPELLGGLPRLRSARMCGEYPLRRIHFEDEAAPLRVALEAYTPMVPLDALPSGLPLAHPTCRVKNAGPTPVDVTVVCWLRAQPGLGRAAAGAQRLRLRRPGRTPDLPATLVAG